MPSPLVLTPPAAAHVFKLAEPAPVPPTTPIDFAAAPQVTGNPRPRQLEALVQQSEAAAAQAALAVATAAEAAEMAAAAAAAANATAAAAAASSAGSGGKSNAITISESGIDEDDAIMNRPVRRSTAVYDKGKAPATAASLRAPVPQSHRKKSHDDAAQASAASGKSPAAAAAAAPHRRTKGTATSTSFFIILFYHFWRIS